MSETDEVVGDLAHGSAVVDAHEGCTGNLARLVADDDRNVTLEHGGKIRIVVGHGVDDKAVDARLLDHGCSIHLVAAGPGRDEQQALAGVLTRFRETGKEAHGGRVTERITECFGEQKTDGTGFASSQGAGDRIRSGVSASLGRLEHSIPQLDGELIGSVVRVRDCSSRHIELGGKRRQSGLTAWLTGPGHKRTLAVVPADGALG